MSAFERSRESAEDPGIDSPPDEPTREPPGLMVGDETRGTPWLEPSPRLEETADLRVGAAPRGGGGGPGGASPRTAAVLYLAVVLVFLGLAPFLQAPFGLAGLVVLQLVCILGPALLYIRLLNLPWREVLSLRKPSPGALAGAALLGGSVWFLLVATLLPIQNLFLPPSEEFLQQREMLFSAPRTLGGWIFLWGAAAVTPAVCEEILFRGVLLHSIRTRRSTRDAVLLVSVMFAIFHFNPYQLSITFVLGIVLGWMVVRTGSILSSMTFHLMNNTVVLALAQVPEETAIGWWAVLLVLAAVVGAVLVWRTRWTR